jgi:hypothetical protein
MKRESVSHDVEGRKTHLRVHVSVAPDRSDAWHGVLGGHLALYVHGQVDS